MKRYIICLTGVLLFSTNCFSQIVNIPDPNFKAALLLDSTINTNGDGEIQVSEAEATDDISVVGNNISDLTGIEAFINITFLECSNNNLTTLDVSNNPALEIFECYDNQLTNITLSNNPELYQFECYNNQLSSLDVSLLPNLVFFFMGNNPITQLDVSNNPLLFIFECRETLLETLDLSSAQFFDSLICNDNTALNYINLKNGNNENMEFNGLFASNFENLPNLETVCVDELSNTDFTNEIMSQVGHPVNFTEDCTLGIVENNSLNIVVYPNPAYDVLFISNQDSNSISATIYDINGRRVSTNSTVIDAQIDISYLEQGVYFVKIIDALDSVHTERFIKK